MRTLIIYGHLHKNGYCGHILKEVIRHFDQKKEDYDYLDLYEMNYDPRVAALNPDDSVITNDEDHVLQKMFKNKRLIIIYPIWWGVMPAILKGFFDRTLTVGFAFKYKGKIPKGLLKNKAIVFQTMGGPRFLIRLMGNRPKKNISKDILGFCGISSRVYQFGSCTGVQKAKIKEISQVVNSVLS